MSGALRTVKSKVYKCIRRIVFMNYFSVPQRFYHGGTLVYREFLYGYREILNTISLQIREKFINNFFFLNFGGEHNTGKIIVPPFFKKNLSTYSGAEEFENPFRLSCSFDILNVMFVAVSCGKENCSVTTKCQ